MTEAYEFQTHIRESLKTSGFTFEPATDPMIVTGGAFSVIRSILGAKPGTTIEGASSVIHKKNISELKSTLCNLSLNERKTIPGLSEARADVMPVALITIDTVLESAGRDTITHSFYNLRYGIAVELLA